MSIYLRTAQGERFLLDTAKCKLVFEETEYELTGATLDFYGSRWQVMPGFVTTDGREEPCQTLVLQDRFSGLGVEVPFATHKADEVALAFRNGGERRFKRIRKLIRP